MAGGAWRRQAAADACRDRWRHMAWAGEKRWASTVLGKTANYLADSRRLCQVDGIDDALASFDALERVTHAQCVERPMFDHPQLCIFEHNFKISKKTKL